MATPKFDSLSIGLSRLVNDPVTNAADDGPNNNLTASSRSDYINRALNELIRRYWAGLTKKEFIQKFPELSESKIIITDSAGKYDISASDSISDLFVPLNAIYGGKSIEFEDSDLYSVIKTGSTRSYKPTASHPFALHMQNYLEFLPSTEFSNKSINLIYLKFPVNPENGRPIIQGGDVDSPFHNIWDDEIINIALRMFNVDAQNI